QVLNDPDSPVAGNPTGDVTVVEFFDYLCNYCKRIIPTIQKLLKQDKNVRYVFKELPILSLDSRLAARAALVVWKNQKEKYLDFHTTLMTSQGSLSEARILRLAKKVGADTTLIKKKMRSNEISAILKRNFDLAQRLGVRGTPGFIIGDKIVPGAIDLTALKSLIAEARKKG
ncbi:MAG: DsbA family protein, partial [Rhodospirillales bacterium]|nr:DsbA family protein [Rhodospirillales bacterium]